MAGKNNAAVIAGIGKISTPRVTDGRSIDFAGAVDSFLRGYDWGDNLRKQKEQEANREALALALQAEDEAQIADAWAKFDPMGYAERLDKIKEARIKREQDLADAEAEHNRNVALEELRNRLGIKRDEATHSRTMALEKLKRDWSLEDKGVEREQQLEDKALERQQQLEDKELERQQQLEDAEYKNQQFYAQKAFEKDLEAQNKDLPLLVREQSKYEKGTPLYNLYGRAIENTIAKMNSSANANVSEKIQLLNEFRKMFPWMTDEQLVEAVQSFYNKNQTQKDTRTTEQKNFDFYRQLDIPPKEALERATKTGEFAPNKPKTPEQIANEEKIKTKSREEAKNEVEKDAALERLRGKYGLFEKKVAPLLKELKTGDADGLGEIEYYLASGSRPLAKRLNEPYYERASINQQAINDLNNLMRDMARDVMTAQNINARQADTTWEQKHLFYDIDPDMDEIRLLERINALKEYLQLVLSGDTSYTPEEKPQAKTESKIKSITREK